MDHRLKEIDIIRGITIILVVSGHVGLPDTINGVLSTFRMPLFFMASGYLFSNSKYSRNYGELLKSRFFRLLLPYFSACLLFYSLWLLRRYTENNDEFSWYAPILGALYGNAEGLVFNMPLWFLVCLFCLQIVFGITLIYLQKYLFKIQLGFYFLLGVTGFIITQFIHLPWGLDIALVMMPFFFIGNLLKEHKILYRVKFSTTVTVIISLIFIVTCFLNAPINASDREYNHFILFYAGGFSGSILVFGVTKILSSSKVLVNFFSELGKGSLSILIFHMGAALTVRSFVSTIGINQFTFDWAVYTIGAVLISLIIDKVIRKIPVLNLLFNGKRRNKSSVVFHNGSHLKHLH